MRECTKQICIYKDTHQKMEMKKNGVPISTSGTQRRRNDDNEPIVEEELKRKSTRHSLFLRFFCFPHDTYIFSTFRVLHCSIGSYCLWFVFVRSCSYITWKKCVDSRRITIRYICVRSNSRIPYIATVQCKLIRIVYRYGQAITNRRLLHSDY